MSLISARTAWDWAKKLADEYSEPFDLILREILAAADRRDLSALNPDDPAETWRIALPVMIEHIDRHRRGHIDPEPVLGPGILGIARSIVIDTAELERWLFGRGIECRTAPASARLSDGGRSDNAAEPAHMARSSLGKPTGDWDEPQAVTAVPAIAAYAGPEFPAHGRGHGTDSPAITPSGIRTATEEKAEAACGEWIAGLTERPRNKETAFADAKAALASVGELSFKAFERAWANRARPEWKRPGRRKTS